MLFGVKNCLMKLIVQIPCLNEETTLPVVLRTIPKKIKGVDAVETLIIDDGSTDKTIEVAKKLGVNHIVRHRKNKGLAAAFTAGINEALRQGADIIVNTDADNQYPQKDIPKLIKPIVDGKYDIVVGDRQTDKIKHFSPLKKLLQKAGSKAVQLASGTNIPDAPSGFRAYSREAAMRLNVVTNFSYCMETIIQAGKKRISITHVPIITNKKTRESRLFKSIGQHVRKSMGAILRSYLMYEPLKVFLTAGVVTFLLGTIPFFRFIYLAIAKGELLSGHLQSIILGVVLVLIGFMLGVVGVIADLISINRKLMEDNLYHMKKLEYNTIYRNWLNNIELKENNSRPKKRKQSQIYETPLYN